MAIFHLSSKPVSRSTGRSAVAAAAYRTADVLTNERDGLTHDYRQRKGVEHTETVMPDGGPADRSALWNAAEAAEKRKDARTAREWVLAIPSELVPRDQRERDLIRGSPDHDLVREFAQALAQRYGVAVDVAIHAPDREGDRRNWHAHLLATTRQVSRDASGGVVLGEKAAIELSDAKRKALGLCDGAEEVKQVRALWAQLANRALEREGCRARIDARSLAAQGIERAPTVHLGPAATAMERSGRDSDRRAQERQQAAAEAAAAVERQQAAADVAQIAAEVARIDRYERPAAIKREWVQTVEQQRAGIAEKATALRARVSAVEQSLSVRAAEHARAKPTPPTGLLAGFKRAAYEKAHEAWKAVSDPLAKRLEQLQGRMKRLTGYLHGGQQGDALAVQRAAKARPDLAASYSDVIERERKIAEEVKRIEKDQNKQRILEGYKRNAEQEKSRSKGRSL